MNKNLTTIGIKLFDLRMSKIGNFNTFLKYKNNFVPVRYPVRF